MVLLNLLFNGKFISGKDQESRAAVLMEAGNVGANMAAG